MKIERNPRGVAQPYRSAGIRPDGARAGQTEAPAAGASASRADQVSLSDQARQIASLRRQIKAAPEVRMELVERIKAAVDAGEYNVPPRKVAERLLRSGVLD